ncbi:MAG: dihydroneopterin aldolase [Actinobacteria bacterium]|nr:dihydroneopterin aldolase [Actinomycetota bacterium]
MNGGERNTASEDRILLEGMIFHGRHGTLPAERELGQPFVVDIELRLDLQAAGLSDDLTRTVDYSEVHRRAKEIVEGPPVSLTETVAERIAGTVLEDYPTVQAVRVKVAKPNVRLDDTVLTGSAVEVLRRREVGFA